MMGLMGLPLAPMLMGTVPIIFLVAPLSLSGSFMIQGTVAPFPALTNIALALSSFSQVGTFVAMLHYVEQITQSEREALELMPYDLEVLELDRKSEEYAALYAELTAWQSKEVPFALRVVLWIGAISGILACQFATLRGSQCFRSFALYPDFPTQLRDNLGGSISNLIMLPGYATLGLIVVCYLCRLAFVCWAGRLVKRRYKSGQRPKAFTTKKTAPDDEPSGSGNASLQQRRLRISYERDEQMKQQMQMNPQQQQMQQQMEQQVQQPMQQQMQQQVPQQQAAGSSSSADGAIPSAPAGGRKLVTKSKPFWEIQMEKEQAAEAENLKELEAAQAARGGLPTPLERSNSALASNPTKERPGREHRKSKKDLKARMSPESTTKTMGGSPNALLEA